MSQDPKQLGGPHRVRNVLGAMERCNANVPGFRRGHARGIGFHATFTATAEAKALSTAEFLQGDAIPAIVRLSNGSASPYFPDRQNAKTGNPLGMAVRFEQPSGETCQWTGLSLPSFAPRVPDDFLAMVEATRPALPGLTPNPLRVAAFVARRPFALNGIKSAAQLPAAKSFATTRFNGMHAYFAIDADGRRRAFRFRWMPVAGIETFDAADDAIMPPQYVVTEMIARVERGPVAWDLVFQLADRSDPTDDMTKLWPESRPLVTIGRLVVDRVHDDQDHVDGLVFDPMTVPAGIEPSDDPILHFRREAYAESQRRRTSETKPAIKPG